MAGRRGARPMPPATRTISPTAPSPTSQPVPYGPRTPTTSPTDVRARACVTAPTSRTVCCSGPSAFAAPLTEIGTSPTPNADSIVNWPGMNSSGGPSVGSSIIVKVSGVSWRRSARRKRRGTIAPACRPTCRTVCPSARCCIGGSRMGSASTGGSSVREQRTEQRIGEPGGAVEVQQPDPGGHQPAEHHLGHELHELVPKPGVLLALAPQASPVEGDRTGAVSFDGRCLRGKCEEDPRLGYELMKLVTQVMFSRLVAARVRLLDLYGTTGFTNPLLSPLLADTGATSAGASHPGATDAAPG